MVGNNGNSLVFNMATGNLTGEANLDIARPQTQFLYEMNRDKILERLYYSEELVNKIVLVLEPGVDASSADAKMSNCVYLNLDCLVDNEDMSLLNLDFKSTSRVKITTRSSTLTQEQLLLEEEEIKTMEDLKISDGTLTKTFLSKLTTLKQHFGGLTKRVNDPNSKILVCGDLNSGKSSFVNKLLNLRDIKEKCVTSPTDQLPLTSVFIEFKHFDFNYLRKKPEIHAIIKNDDIEDENDFLTVVESYDCMNPDTYDIFELHELESLVSADLKSKYSLLVVYVSEEPTLPKEQSLLKNGVVDCSVIDSPGLNMDDFVTKDIFSKQETIDLIIFVINAENQLTLSGKDLINTAKTEKNFIFFVVNKFDQIRDKERCTKLIMNQIQELSPLTYKQHDDFVHCVSSKKDEHPDAGPDGGDDDNDASKPDLNFEKLRDSIKDFVVLKKSKNKLLPSQTFLNNLLRDLYFLTEFNIKIYSNKIQLLSNKLLEIRPEIEAVSSSNIDFNKKLDYLIDSVVDTGYDYVRDLINRSLDDVTLPDYHGISSIYDYVMENLDCMNDRLEESVISSELYGKKIAFENVSKIYDMNHIAEADRSILNEDFMSGSGNKFSDLQLTLLKEVNVWFELSDLFEPSWEGFFNFLINGGSIPKTKSTGEISGQNQSSFFEGLVSQFGFIFKNPTLIFNSRIPALALYSFGGTKIVSNLVVYGSSMLSWNSLANIATTLFATGGCLVGAYLINDLPRALPYNLINKYKETLRKSDFAHSQATRITKDIRRVLKIPQLDLITRNNSILFDIKEKEKNWQMIVNKLNMDLDFLKSYQKAVVSEQQKLMEVVLEVD